MHAVCWLVPARVRKGVLREFDGHGGCWGWAPPFIPYWVSCCGAVEAPRSYPLSFLSWCRKWLLLPPQMCGHLEWAGGSHCGHWGVWLRSNHPLLRGDCCQGMHPDSCQDCDALSCLTSRLSLAMVFIARLPAHLILELQGTCSHWRLW